MRYTVGSNTRCYSKHVVGYRQQQTGPVGGVLAPAEVMSAQFKYMLELPSLKVDLHTRSLAEEIWTFTTSELLAMSTVVVVVAGSAMPTFHKTFKCEYTLFFSIFWENCGMLLHYITIFYNLHSCLNDFSANLR